MVKIVFATLLIASTLHAAPLEKEFAAPPHEYRPETWFHLLDGHIANDGLSADLAAIAGAGISGIQVFQGSGGPWPPGTPNISVLGPQWDDAIRHTGQECRRLNLSFTMQDCPGWTTAGGPWIAPSEAMRHLVWSRSEVSGGAPVALDLPQPQPSGEAWRDYCDVAVLAFPTPDGENQTLVPRSVKSNKPDFPWLDLFDPSKKVTQPLNGSENVWVELEFAAPVTLRSLEFPPLKDVVGGRYFDPGLVIRVQAVTPNGLVDVARREMPRSTWLDDYPLTLALPEATAPAFRITFERSKPGTMSLSFMRLSAAARADDWEGRAGFVLRSLDLGPAPRQSRAAWIDTSKIVDLTAQTLNGALNWNAPAGKWTILRFGHVNTGARNAPAPAEATGFESDKFSSAAVEKHFANYLGRLSAPGGPAQGTLNGLLIDSWECHTQTWTPLMEAEFSRRRGYELRRWLPAIAGYVVDDQETSLRFLRDWRATISDLVTENFYGRTAQLAHSRGLKVSFETALGDVAPGDILQYLGKADVPMCEFWQSDDPDRGGEETKPFLPTVSAAHIYGKRRVAAEAFTSVELRWNEHPAMLKPYADKAFARGVNHLVFHTYTHNPRLTLPPGTSFAGGIGTPFLRGQTWWKQMPAFTDYLARCQMMLERGRPVADVLWYLGDEFDHKPRQDAPFPTGYHFDYCNQDVLLHRLTVKNGLLTTPEGATWRVLWLPDCPRLTPETLEKLRDLLRAGATIIAAPARENATLSGGAAAQKRFTELVRELWPTAGLSVLGGSYKLGSGRLEWWNNSDTEGVIRTALRGLRVAPDVINGESAHWCHRRDGDTDIYFVAAPRGMPLRGAIGFRAMGRAELFDPLTGQTRLAPVAKSDGTHTFVALDLAPSASTFVVFRPGTNAATTTRIERDGKLVLDAATPPQTDSGLRVLKAFYGDEKDATRQFDVTQKVRAEIAAGATTITGHNGWAGGDPALRTVKTLIITVQTETGTQTLRGSEGQPIALPVITPAALPCEILPGGGLLALENGRYRVTNAKGKTRGIAVNGAHNIALSGPWTLRFPPGWDVPQSVDLPALQAWSDLENPAARFFSGTAVYACEVKLEKPMANQRFILDLGRVANSAEVTINGKRAALLWASPYRLDATPLLKAGANRIEIAVTNTWRNRLIYDASLPENQRKTWTIAGPPANAAPEPAGLIGLVQLRVGIVAP